MQLQRAVRPEVGSSLVPLPVNRSVVDMVVCDSEVEEKFAIYLDGRDDVPLFFKLPDWYKIPTPLGNYNPDWALVRERESDRRYYLVRETKGGSDIEKLRWESEGWKIRCGEAHYDAIDVDYAFGHDPVKLIEPSSPAQVVPIRSLVLVDDVEPLDRYVTYLPVYSLQARTPAGHGGASSVSVWLQSTERTSTCSSGGGPPPADDAVSPFQQTTWPTSQHRVC